jgi:CheY-like chemotaxis protein
LRTEALAASRDASTADISLANIRVLVVEDEPDAAEFVTSLLEQHGADVVSAASAREALEAVAHSRPDILLSDIGLPDMDGYQLMEHIRKLDVAEGGGILAVAVTAFARSEDRTRALLAGYQTHLAKPIESPELVATVASFAELVHTRRTDTSGHR